MTRAQEILKAAKNKQHQINKKNLKEISNLFEDKNFSKKLEKVMEIKK
mgnify:CR=1 FL=1